jgi:hypothetical protein
LPLARTIVVGIAPLLDDPAGIAASLPLASAFAVVDDGIEFQLDRV